MPKQLLRTFGNYDTDAASLETALECKDKSLTQQSQMEDADINVIVKRFGLTGQLPQNVAVPLNEEFEDAVDFKEMMNLKIQADRAFMEMPADVRARFNNDPVRFVDFCSNEENIEECVKLGLAIKKPVVVKSPPMEVVVVNETAPSLGDKK